MYISDIKDTEITLSKEDILHAWELPDHAFSQASPAPFPHHLYPSNTSAFGRHFYAPELLIDPKLGVEPMCKKDVKRNLRTGGRSRQKRIERRLMDENINRLKYSSTLLDTLMEKI